LASVTVLAIVTTGYIALWAAGDSLRVDRETHAAAMATAVANTVGNTVAHDFGDAEVVRRLEAVLHRFAEATKSVEFSVVGTGRREIVSWPPRAVGDGEAAIISTALAGGPPVINYRVSPEGAHKQLVAYAAIEREEQVLGVARVVMDATPPTEVVLRRSGLLLLVLVILDALLVLGLSYVVLTQLVVRPLEQLRRATARVSAGELEARIPLTGAKEIVALASAFETMTDSLSAQREQLIRSEKLASVGQLAAGVAHEIGNPLATILGYVDILRGEAEGKADMPKAERVDALLRVKAETQRIDQIIRDLLDYSRPIQEEPIPTDPMRIIVTAQGLLAPQARFRGVKILFSPVADSWPSVLIPPRRLVQVFLNLLMNAADAMSGKGTVVVVCETQGDQVMISVIDEGPGVPDAIRGRIFDPFFTTKAVGQGTGLGLSVSRAIVENAGGNLELASARKGQGTTFLVTLPKAADTQEPVG
jgi:signal transduction histidine kinase